MYDSPNNSHVQPTHDQQDSTFTDISTTYNQHVPLTNSVHILVEYH